MALNWNMSDVTDWDAKCSSPYDPEQMNAIADSMVWLTMYLGIPVIDDEHLQQFKDRLALYQRVNGPELNFVDGDAAYMTGDDVDRFKGLRTNASPKSRQKFEAEILSALKGQSCEDVQGKNPDGLPAWRVLEKKAAEFKAGQKKEKTDG